MSRENSLIKNTFVLSLGTFLPKAFSVITLPILTACLTKTEYGIYDLLHTMVSLLLPTATLQIQTAAFRYLIIFRDNRERKTSIITNIFAFSASVSFITLGVCYLLFGNIARGERVLILLYFLADIFRQASLQIARGLGKNEIYSAAAIISSFLNVALIVIGVFFCKGGLTAVLLALLVESLFSWLFVTYRAGIYKFIDRSALCLEEIKVLIQYSWPMIPNSMSLWVMNLSDRLVITSFLGIDANAVYAVATRIPQILSLAQSAFTMAWQENASISAGETDVREYYSRMFSVYYDFMVGFCAVLIACTPYLFSLLVKGGYDDAYVQMPILFLGVFFAGISSFFGGIYVAYTKTKSVGITTVLAACINLLMDLFLVRKIGIFAGSVSTVAGYLFLVIFRMTDVRKLVHIRYDFGRIIFLMLLLIVMCALCFARITVFYWINLVIGCTAMAVLNGKRIVCMIRKLMDF